MKQFIIAVDFDGTVVKHRFPAIGDDVPHCEEVLKELQSAGYTLVLNTMRSDGPGGNYLTEAVKWFTDRGITLWGVNINPDQKKWTTSPKVYAHLYIDDAALGAPLIYEEKERPYIDWLRVMEYFMKPKVEIETIHK